MQPIGRISGKIDRFAEREAFRHARNHYPDIELNENALNSFRKSYRALAAAGSLFASTTLMIETVPADPRIYIGTALVSGGLAVKGLGHGLGAVWRTHEIAYPSSPETGAEPNPQSTVEPDAEPLMRVELD